MCSFKKAFSKFSSVIFVLLIILVWQVVSGLGVVGKFMLPSPIDVIVAFYNDFFVLISNSITTLKEAILGLLVSIIISFVTAFVMDRFEFVYKAAYPILIITQTIPVVAIAPLLVLWLGYDIKPKVVLVAIVCFFPITVGLLEGLKTIDSDSIRLVKSMGATNIQIFRYVKFPSSLPLFFGGLKIAVSYSVVGAVIAEWLGGYDGLGVYMIRVKKSYAFDKMFAVIFLISFISLLLIKAVDLFRAKVMPWISVLKEE